MGDLVLQEESDGALRAMPKGLPIAVAKYQNTVGGSIRDRGKNNLFF